MTLLWNSLRHTGCHNSWHGYCAYPRGSRYNVKSYCSYEFSIVESNFDSRDGGKCATFTHKSRVYFAFIWTDLHCVSSEPKFINYSNTHVVFYGNWTVRYRLGRSIYELVHTPISKECIIKSWDFCTAIIAKSFQWKYIQNLNNQFKSIRNDS